LGYKVNLSWKPNILLQNREKYRIHVPGDESKEASNKMVFIEILMVRQLFYKSNLLK